MEQKMELSTNVRHQLNIKRLQFDRFQSCIKFAIFGTEAGHKIEELYGEFGATVETEYTLDLAHGYV